MATFTKKAKEKLGFGGKKKIKKEPSGVRSISKTIATGSSSLGQIALDGRPSMNFYNVQSLQHSKSDSQDLHSSSHRTMLDSQISGSMKQKPKAVRPEGTIEHVVSGRESLACIAAHYDVTVSDITKASKLMSRTVFPGQVLYVPDKDFVPTKKITSSSPPASDPLSINIVHKVDVHFNSGMTSPGHAERLSPPQLHQDDEKPVHVLSEEEAKKLDEECLERFIKIHCKQITMDKGSVRGVLLVTPNAIMFDPDVMDPLVVESGADTYGLIAPMEMVISVAMYHDISHMTLKRTENYVRPNSPISAVYHVPECEIHQNLQALPTDNDSCVEKNVNSVTKQVVQADIHVQDGISDNTISEDSNKLHVEVSSRTRTESQCSCGAIKAVLPDQNNEMSESNMTAEINEQDQEQEIKMNGARKNSEHETKTEDVEQDIAQKAQIDDSENVASETEQVGSEEVAVNNVKSVETDKGNLEDVIAGTKSVLRDVNNLKENECINSILDATGDNDDETERQVSGVETRCDEEQMLRSGSVESGIAEMDDTKNGDASVTTNDYSSDVFIKDTDDQDEDANAKDNRSQEYTQFPETFEIDDSGEIDGDSNAPKLKRKITGSIKKLGSATTGGIKKVGSATSGGIKKVGSATTGGIKKMGSAVSLMGSTSIHAFVDFSSGLFSRSQEEVEKVKDINELGKPATKAEVNKVGSSNFYIGSPAHNSIVSDEKQKIHVQPILTSAVSFEEKPELFQSFDEMLYTAPTSPVDGDPPLFLCIRIGVPINIEVSKTCPIESYNRRKKKPEYWFSIPRERVDQLYAFFIQWSPSLYGDEEDIDPKERGFVVLNWDDDETEAELFDSMEISEEHFSDDLEGVFKKRRGLVKRAMSKDWEIVKIEEGRQRIPALEVEDSLPLPELIGESNIIDTEHIAKLVKVMPPRTEGYPWNLVYSTEQHGFSIKTMFRHMDNVDSPILLLVQDTGHNIFGAVTSCELHASEHFYGRGESFLFTFTPEFKVYQWTGDNSFFIKSNCDSLAIGAGEGAFGLWLDADFYHGHTQHCQTYGNEPLTVKEDFLIKTVEFWSFE